VNADPATDELPVCQLCRRPACQPRELVDARSDFPAVDKHDDQRPGGHPHITSPRLSG
jgi:hypothetical protein